MDSRSKLCVDLDTKRYCYRKGLPETMNKLNHTNTIKNYRFPSSLFLVYFLVLLLMSGIHTGIIVGMNALGWNKIIQVILPLGYWTVVAVGLTFFTKNVIRKSYEKPMHDLADATKKVAEGDFSVYVPTLHTADRLDYLDVMIIDFNKMVEELGSIETLKTDFFSNVSHDIKTPLTSIINYVDLLEKEDLHNETAQEYLEVLERQSSRLKKLIEDLIEASKASTGNLPVHLERLEAGIFMTQTVGEFEEKTKAAGLDLVIEKPETPVYIMADSRHFWRVIDNLMNNICKYAQSGTRVYINLEVKEAQVSITFRNTSKYPLNISSDELMERFVRGDASRNTEGSGLGLSIANSLMDLMGGTFRLYVDGDLFKVVLGFAETAEKETKEKNNKI